ncbi:ABC transporter ATP-binding protein [soil metagenome]
MTDRVVAAVELRDLRREFGGLTAIDDLSIRVEAGSIFGLLGPNGAGKTTVLNLLTGLDSPTAGDIRVFGESIVGLSPHEIARRDVARTYQNVRLFEGLSVLENVIAGAWRHRRSRIWQAPLLVPSERAERRIVKDEALAMLEKVGVLSSPSRLVGTLPYAEQRRVEIARALASRPRLLLLDEPTAGMNATESAAIGELLVKLREQDNMTLLLIEHNMKLVLTYCDSAAVMSFGQLLTHGTPRDCVDDPLVREAYFGGRKSA